jgi:predicted DNA-binding protein (UPF0251 family)
MDESSVTAAEVPQKAASSTRRYRKLTLADQVLVCRLMDSDPTLTQREAARRLQLDERTVSRALKMRGIPAMDILRSGEQAAATAWLRSIGPASRKGDHRAARDLLLHTRAIEPVHAEQSHGITIVFGLGMLPGTESHTPRELRVENASNIVDVPATVQDVE